MALEENHQRQKTCEDPQSVPTLPTENIFEILLRLPVDSLLRCKTVCKSWCSLISDPHFVKSHLRFSTSNNHYAQHRLMFNTEPPLTSIWPSIDFKTCNPYDVLNDNSIKALYLDSPFEHTPVSIVGSCNGLLCMAMREGGLFIWNPSTRKSNRLPYCPHQPPPLDCYVQYGFGHDEYTDDYKVFEFSCNVKDRATREVFVQVYSLKNGRWNKRVTFPHGFIFHEYGKFFNGALHWSASKDLGSSSSWTIVSLDLANETYGEVLQPVYGIEEGNDKDLTLGCLREGLCVLCDYHRIRVDLWVMKVYGVKDSWTKLVSIPYLGWDKFSVPLCLSEDGKVLLQFGSELIVYDSYNRSFSYIQNICRHFEPCIFVESLVSPDNPRRSWR